MKNGRLFPGIATISIGLCYGDAGTFAFSAAASTALYGWAARGRTDKLMLLLEQRGDLDYKDSGGRTPVHAASSNGHNEALQWLLDHTATADAPDSRGQRPLHLAALGGHVETMSMLLRAQVAAGGPANDLGQEPLHLAVQSGIPEAVYILLMSNADIEKEDSWAMTPLHWAAFAGHVPCAELLLASGASAHARDEDGVDFSRGPIVPEGSNEFFWWVIIVTEPLRL